jgi:hypothetical protein
MKRTIVAFMAILTMVGLIIPTAVADDFDINLEVLCSVGGSIDTSLLSFTAVPPQSVSLSRALAITSTDETDCPNADVYFANSAWLDPGIRTSAAIDSSGPTVALTTTSTAYPVTQGIGSHTVLFIVDVGASVPVGSYSQNIYVTIV